MNHASRAPKHLGDFGEGLATYTLIRKGYEVASVDHVGADLIAERNGYRIAVSVKTRRFREDSVETRGLVIEDDHLGKLELFANRFDLDPVFAHVVCANDEKIIHLFMMRVADLKTLDHVKHGYRLRFDARHLSKTIALPFVDYSCWTNEQIGERLGGARS